MPDQTERVKEIRETVERYREHNTSMGWNHVDDLVGDVEFLLTHIATLTERCEKAERELANESASGGQVYSDQRATITELQAKCARMKPVVEAAREVHESLWTDWDEDRGEVQSYNEVAANELGDRLTAHDQKENRQT